MKFIVAFTALFAATFMAVTNAELPITTSDVFVQSGEVMASSAIVMTRCNSEEDSIARITYKIRGSSSSISFTKQAYEANDYTAKFGLSGLTSNTIYDYSVTCTANIDSDITSSRAASFKTLPAATDEVELSFVWAADLAGQGWGRNPNLSITTVGGKNVTGGYLVFEVMSDLNPDFAVFQGDMIYADNAIRPNQTIPASVGGGLYINNPSKDFVAVTLEEFRDNWKYNFGDEKMQSFLAKTPVYVQWDDHEVTNNWYPTEIYTGPLYPNGTAVDSMYENSLQAFYEFNPINENNTVIYRSQRFGKHLEIFFVDLRTFRDPNPRNSDTTLAAMMGPTQLAWLKDRLLRSTATHKVKLQIRSLLTQSIPSSNEFL
jgi:alkaline phosphatase D